MAKNKTVRRKTVRRKVGDKAVLAAKVVVDAIEDEAGRITGLNELEQVLPLVIREAIASGPDVAVHHLTGLSMKDSTAGHWSVLRAHSKGSLESDLSAITAGMRTLAKKKDIWRAIIVATKSVVSILRR